MTKCITYRHGKAALIEDGLFGTRASNEGYPETREDFTITEKENVKALGTFNQEKALVGELFSSPWYIAINIRQIGNFLNFRGKNLFSKLHLSFLIHVYSGQPSAFL